MPTNPLTIKEIKQIFFLTKSNECPGYDEISFNATTLSFNEPNKKNL